MPGETVAANIVAIWCYVVALRLNQRREPLGRIFALLAMSIAALAIGVVMYVT